jgi:hypothetical protein
MTSTLKSPGSKLKVFKVYWTNHRNTHYKRPALCPLGKQGRPAVGALNKKAMYRQDGDVYINTGRTEEGYVLVNGQRVRCKA